MMIGLFGLFVWRGLHIARHARDAFGMYLAGTLTAMIGFEAFFNLGVAMGIIPPKGLVLPFISYGSTAMQCNLFAVGILLSIAAESDTVPVTEGWPNRKPSLADPGPSALPAK
jgi:cell division protein FtsW